ncbi:MAG: hypothetical protein U0414_12720 [Polyangiaceae bacterium]
MEEAPHQILASHEQEGCGKIARYGADLYYGTSKGLYRLPSAGGAPERLFAGEVTDFLVDALGIVVAQTTGGLSADGTSHGGVAVGRIARLTNGELNQLGPPLGRPRGLTAMGGSIYFVSEDYVGEDVLPSLGRMPRAGGDAATVFAGSRQDRPLGGIVTDGATLYFSVWDGGLTAGYVVLAGSPSRNTIFRLAPGRSQPEVFAIDDLRGRSGDIGGLVLDGGSLYYRSDEHVYRRATSEKGLPLDEDGQWRVEELEGEQLGWSAGPFATRAGNLYWTQSGYTFLMDKAGKKSKTILGKTWHSVIMDDKRLYWVVDRNSACSVETMPFVEP